MAVWGGGKVGLMARQSAYLLDTERVIAIGRLPERLQMATEKVGAKTIDYTQVDSVCSAIDKFPDPRDHEQEAYTGAPLNTMDKIRAVLVRACHQR